MQFGNKDNTIHPQGKRNWKPVYTEILVGLFKLIEE